MGIAKPTITNRVNGMKMRGKQAKQCIAIGDCDIPSDLVNSVNAIIIGDLAAKPYAITDTVIIGPQAGRVITGGNGNVIIGNLSVNSLEYSSHNTTVGDATLRFLTSGSGHCVMGYDGAEHKLSGYGCCYIGSYCATYSRTGDYNNIVGHYGGSHDENFYASIGDNCNGMGYRVLQYAEGDYLIAMGTDALQQYKGSHSIGIGNKTGLSVTSATATNNIFIGQNSGNAVGFQKVDAINTICIGADTFSQLDNTVLIGNPSIVATKLRGNLTCGSIQIVEDWHGSPGPTNGAVWKNSGNLYITSNTSSTKFLSNDNGLFLLEIYNDGRINMAPPTSSVPNNNGQVTFEFTSNTTITIKGKGTDGTVRSVALTLA